MAKKKNKGAGADENASESKADKASEKKADAPAHAPIEKAFAAGNYSDVRAIAKAEPSATANRLVELVKIDKGQLIVGLIAIAVVLTVAALTLH
jgi:hypothetical protein